MKITKEHYEHLKTEISKLDKTEVEKHAKAVKVEGKFHDFSKRMRWDIWRAAGLLKFTCDVLYEYMNDDHVDTALRSVLKDLGYSFVA